MRQLFLALAIGSPILATAQFPPVDVDWSALRGFGDGNTMVARDPIGGDHIWSVLDDIMLATNDDELLYPILADGTDLAPASPGAVNVGSLDHLVDIERYNSRTYVIISHQNIGGMQDVYWHVQGGANDLTIQSPEEDLDDVPHDLLVNADGLFIAGSSRVISGAYEGRLIRADHDANVLWDVSWSPNGTVAGGAFTAIAVKGDSLLAIAYPLMVIFDKSTGSYIGQADITIGLNLPGGWPTRVAVSGSDLYWIRTYPTMLEYGHFQMEEIIGSITQIDGLAPSYRTSVSIDASGRPWFAYTDNGTGRWIKADSDAMPTSSGSLYGSISDMRHVNGKLLFTGQFDASQGTSYVVCGTPQP